MAQGTPLPSPDHAQAGIKHLRSVPLEVVDVAHCELCGQPLGEHAGHFHMVSPLTARRVTVCRTCRRAALSEGYLPRA